ncbi:RHS repeat-associated core domain-containing protein [Paenibacillus thalictri]|uniref:RHS repeat-associated core domain-containing protein n=1 Tax=Paenibacillus thalictri TaxID=2527873 RepID=A0A4Q9DI37_9BACL|nr:RHS repeat-associated core domain-containing protein [Paenibacillus thalictri]TBL71228.1 hypothetical protein EYB31_31135 [Paenibacillus thalictri]
MNDRFILQALIFIVQLSVADPGRFISEDSYWGEDSNPLSLNLYTYVTNNPIMFVDPSGHSAATATYSQEYEDALREMAKGDDGNAIWAQNEIENKGWYKDENGSVYSKDEVLHALYPDWYSTPANITVGGEQIGNARVENGVSTGNLTDIAKGLGGSVQWNENTRTATLALGNQIVTYNLNDMVHGQGVASDGTMFRISNDNKLQVSVRDVATTANASGKDSSANQIT